MTESKTRIAICLLAAAVLVAGLTWSVEYLDDRRAAAAAAVRQCADCQRLAAQIEERRSDARASGSPAISQSDLAGEIDSAAKAAGLSARSLDRIDHDADRHSASGDSVQRPTRIVLRRVTVRQAMTFLHKLSRPADALGVERIHLTAADQPAGEELWTCEATVLSAVPPTAPAPSLGEP